jgi:helicase
MARLPQWRNKNVAYEAYARDIFMKHDRCARAMHLKDIATSVPSQVIEILAADGIDELRPAQAKAIDAGLLAGENLLVCTPTASGKTLIAEFAALKAILQENAKAIYIVPLVALASEKVQQFRKRWGKHCRVALSVGDMDSADPHLSDYDLIVCTAEKLDSLLRHHAPWLRSVRVIVVDEVHLLNDVSRGPTLEVLLTLLRRVLPKAQLLALSATIGNPRMLADWLGATLIEDDWRPTALHKGVFYEEKVWFEEEPAEGKKGK